MNKLQVNGLKVMEYVLELKVLNNYFNEITANTTDHIGMYYLEFFSECQR